MIHKERHPGAPHQSLQGRVLWSTILGKNEAECCLPKGLLRACHSCDVEVTGWHRVPSQTRGPRNRCPLLPTCQLGTEPAPGASGFGELGSRGPGTAPGSLLCLPQQWLLELSSCTQPGPPARRVLPGASAVDQTLLNSLSPRNFPPVIVAVSYRTHFRDPS